MRSVSHPVHLALRASVHFRRDVVPLVTAVVLGAALLVGLGMVRASIEEAGRASIRAHFGGGAHIVQPITDQARAAAAEVDEWWPVADAAAMLTAQGRAAPAQVRTFTDASLALGLLQSGGRPAAPGEGMLASALATDLGVGIGDAVQVRDQHGLTRQLRVTGIITDPLVRASNQAYLLDAELADGATAFIAPDDPLTQPATARLLVDGQLTYASGEQLEIRSAHDAVQSSLSAGHFLGAGVVLVVVFATVIGASGQIRRLAPSVSALRAAGVPAASRRIFLLLATAVPLLAAGLLGGVLGSITVVALRTPLAELFGQAWSTVRTAPVEWLMAMAPAFTGAVLALCWGRTGWRHVSRGLLSRTAADALVPAALVVPTLAVASAGLLFADTLGMQTSLLAMVFAAAGMLLIPWPISVLLRRAAMAPIIRRALLPAGNTALVVAVVVSALLTGVVWLTGTAGFMSDRADQTSAESLPAGSLAVDSIPASQAKRLSETYAELGGRTMAEYTLPVETDQSLRVADPDSSACVRAQELPDPFAAGEACGAIPSIRYVVLESGSADGARVAPVMERNGVAHLFVFAPDAPVEGPIDIPVTADPTLVEPLAGMVVGAESDMARDLGLVAGDLRQVVLLDFGQLASDDRAHLRGLVLRSAPGAEMIERPREGFQPADGLFVILGLAAGALAALLFWAGARGTASAAAVPLGVMALFGAGGSGTKALRGTVAWLWTGTVVTSTLAGLGLAWMVAGGAGLTPGWLWVVAPTAVLVTLVAAALRAARRLGPGRSGDGRGVLVVDGDAG